MAFASALALFAACGQDKYDLDSLIPDEYSKILYIQQYGNSEVTLYNADGSADYIFSVNMGGRDYLSKTASCDLRLLTQSEVDSRYSIPEGASYKVITKGYAFDNTHLDFAVEEFYKTVTLTMTPSVIEEEIASAPNSIWVIPVFLYSESDRVNDEKDEIFIRVEVKRPSVGFTEGSSRIVKYDNGHSRTEFVEFGIDATNQWDLQCEFKVDEEYAARMYPGYALLPEECYDFSSSMPLFEGEQNDDLMVTFKDNVSWGEYVLPIRMTSSPVETAEAASVFTFIIRNRRDWEVTGKFDEREWDCKSHFSHLLDGDTGTFWASDWNGPDAIDQPVILVIDTKAEQSFSKVGFVHYHDPDPEKAVIDDNHNYTLEFYVSSDSRTWWNYDHDAFWLGKTAAGVERGDVDTSWKTETNWVDQRGWEKVGAVGEMRSLHNPEVEYIELDSSKSGRYFIIKCPEGGRGRRDMLEFAEIELVTAATDIN